MTRAIPEWIAEHDDQAIPPRVQVRVFDRTSGLCAICTRPLVKGKWACDHIIALVNGGKHRESNLQPLCVSPCHSEKTKADLAEKRIVARKRRKDIGIRAPSRMQSAGFRKAPPQRTASKPIERRT